MGQQPGMLIIQVIDTENSTAIEGCHALINDKTVGVTNPHGECTFNAKLGDILSLSCVGFIHREMQITDGDLNLPRMIVFMEPEEIVLNEIVVSDYPSEEEFKKMILDYHPPENTLQLRAKANLQALWLNSIYGPAPKMTAEENFRYYLNGPQPVFFYSSSGNRGILKAIKSFRSKNTFYNKNNFISTSGTASFDFWRNDIRKDSVINTLKEISEDFGH